MAWYDDDYKYRQAITYLSGSASTTDMQFAIPDEWDHFWDNIDSNGYGLRVTTRDGMTVVAHQLTSFNATTRTGTIQLDSQNVTANQIEIYWLYYGIDSPTDGSSSLTISGAVSMSIWLGDVRNLPIIDAVTDPYGASNPVQAIPVIDEADQIFVFRIPLQKSAGTLNGRDFYEYLAEVYTTASGHYIAGAATTTPSSVYVTEIEDETYVVLFVALSSSTPDVNTIRLDYATVYHVGSGDIETRRQVRALLEIQDLTEA